MSSRLRVACIQINVGGDMRENVSNAVSLAYTAVDQGADLIMTPEHFSFIGGGRAMRSSAEVEERHPALTAFREFATSTGTWILLGSLAIETEGKLLANRSILLDADGNVAARYDKVHMFDATLPSGRMIRESKLYQPGCTAVLTDTPWGALGLSVCYDLRFPQLYRTLAQEGAAFLSIPAAFAESTGEAHWHVLLRARAIESGCFVFAPATCGIHLGNLATYGHSLIVDPWGTVLADGGRIQGVVTADIDSGKIASSRELVPSLQHDQSFALPTTPACWKAPNTESCE